MVGGGSWGGSRGNSPAQDDTTILRDNYGLTAATANNGAPTDSLANNNKPLYYKNPETGATEAMTLGVQGLTGRTPRTATSSGSWSRTGTAVGAGPVQGEPERYEGLWAAARRQGSEERLRFGVRLRTITTR